ncbi:exo-beta-N-acetylmuramidase NamZ domain-containing protein [Mucilaginibacter humi]|uniref:exo-beta-N-acetylmuramidase NamZ domain-containing protein n=1 Tax=Mucilaginibacter humi TaxID=2732510 RepID=UPI00293C0032|nr:exo-beta-N-acetylmuramidase NamZ domain-containing protein [Mucilaginibacter humi]
MKQIKYLFLYLLMALLPLIVEAYAQPGKTPAHKIDKPIVTGADQTKLYVNYLKGKNVGMVVNQTSIIGKNKTPSPDSLLKLGVKIKKIYGPEHGFRGNASNGAAVGNEVDAKTGIPVISLYGSKHYKPTVDDLKGIDVMVFDIRGRGCTLLHLYINPALYNGSLCRKQYRTVDIRPAQPQRNYH